MTNIPQFQRGNFVVSDLDRALRFYCDILGFDLAFIKDSNPNSYSYSVFEIPRERPIRFAVLSAPDQPRCMALTEIGGSALDPVPMPRRSAIVVRCSDIDGVVAASQAEGLKVYDEEVLQTQDGRTGREVGIADHDGNLVVIYTITAQPAE